MPVRTIMGSAHARRFSEWYWALAITLAVLAAYAPALRAGFIWNDSDYVTNPALRPVAGLERIWLEPGVTEQYYPLLHSVFWLEHRAWGDSPFGYHLVSVLLHASAACLFGLLLRRLNVAGAWWAALFFALHPVCVESVAWISEQKNTVSLNLYLAAAIAYLRFDERRSRARYLLALGCFLLALWGKTVTATLPGALLVLGWWRGGKLDWRRDVVPLVPWFVIGAGQGLFSGWVESKFIGAEGAEFTFSATQRVLIAGRMVWFYLSKLCYPANLTFVYPRWDVRPDVWWQFLFPTAAVALLVVLSRLRARAPLAAALFFGGSLFPTLGFFNIYFYRYSFVGDHFQYLASLGIFAFAGSFFAMMVAGGRAASRMVRLVPGVAGALVFGVMTAQQCRMYQDDRSLWTLALERNPDCWLAKNHLGVMATEAGQTDEAIRDLMEVLRVRPDDPDAMSNFGNALLRAGRANEAMAQFQASLHLKPNSPEACNNLGNAFAQLGQPDQAMACYRRAVRLRPDFATALSNLGAIMMQLGRLDEAVRYLEASVACRPDFADAHCNLGGALLRLGRADEALRHYDRAVELRPGYVDAWCNSGMALAQVGRFAEARGRFEQVLRLSPNHAAALDSLAQLAAIERAGATNRK